MRKALKIDENAESNCQKQDLIGHFHIHIIPRVGNEFQDNREIYYHLRAYDSDLIRFYKTKLCNENVAKQTLKNSSFESERLSSLVKEFSKEIFDQNCPIQL